MSDPIRFTIRAQNAETDAPTVEDLLAQIGDWNSILRGVEQALAEDGASEIEWRVTGASKNSPLAFELTAFPRRHGMKRVKETVGMASFGATSISSPQITVPSAMRMNKESSFPRDGQVFGGFQMASPASKRGFLSSFRRGS